jgi:hypothetical protein
MITIDHNREISGLLYLKVFRGLSYAIGLYVAGNHHSPRDQAGKICFDVLYRSSGVWRCQIVINGSAMRIPELVEALNAANDWLNIHADPIMATDNPSEQIGWKPKEESANG